ncbi:Crp/Fnr family transcriptional regulator [Bradyrhizobium sp. AZCC 2289]|uniref:Crp/Fnr family transcriptional regulator n=1 Tax=Bradyrhizobium sp. AZCC 2289 TaxID=3117026 RepID=UPI003071171E
MMKGHTSVDNQLLAALPPADLGLLAPHLQQISLKQDAVLVRLGDRNEQVYFPHSGTISFMLDMPNGQTVATSVIGHEGAVGMLSVLGPSRSPTTAVVRVAGIASQISASRFHAAFGQSSAIKHAVQTHTRAVLMQLQHVAACNALHPVESRMARWSLHIHDRIEGNFIPLTQEALSELLGVRRTTVTLAVRKLRASGAFRSARRGLVEIDRPRLEESACECYKVMRCQYHQIFPLDTTKPHIRAAPAGKTPGDRDSHLAE